MAGFVSQSTANGRETITSKFSDAQIRHINMFSCATMGEKEFAAAGGLAAMTGKFSTQDGIQCGLPHKVQRPEDANAAQEAHEFCSPLYEFARANS